MANEVRFTVKLNVDGQTKVVDATASVEELEEAIGDVRKAADNIGLSKGWETMMLGVNAATDMLGKLKGTVDDLANSYESWETSMAAVNTMAGKDAAGLAQLTDQVSELSKTIPKAREELADGLYQTISNGVPEADWLTFLETSAKASVGGIADLGETVKVTSTVIKNYGLEWSQAGEIQDKIQMTAKNGVTSFGELASALPRVTANAATLGVSVDELMATFATLTGVSGNTAEVSTQLAAIFTALVKPSSEAAKMAQAMGIEFDAAAIKAAGGMQQFLTQLDEAVRQYAKSHGMLEQEIYGSLFGSAESLRALIPLTGELKDKFVENVGQMGDAAGTCQDAFGQVASTGASQMQLLKNVWLSMTEPLGQLASSMRPVVNGLMSIVQAGLYLRGLIQSVTALRNAHVLSTAATAAHSAATRVLGTVSAATGVSVNTLKVAVRNLEIATGVGAAIAALTLIVEKLAGASDNAAQSERNLTQASESLRSAEEAGIQAAASAKAEMDKEIQKLGELIQSKGDTTSAVQTLNEKYGEWFGQCKTAQQWYDTLIANSEAYCDQLAIEAEMRILTERKVELGIRRNKNLRRGQELADKGKLGNWGEGRDVVVELQEIDKEAGIVEDRLSELKSQVVSSAGATITPKRRTVSPSGTGSGKGGKTGKTGKGGSTTPVYAEGELGWYDQEIEKLNKKKLKLSDPEEIRDLNQLIKNLERAKAEKLWEADPRSKVKDWGSTAVSSVSPGADLMKTDPSIIGMRPIEMTGDDWTKRIAQDWEDNKKAMEDYFASFQRDFPLKIYDKAKKAAEMHNKKLQDMGSLIQSAGQSFATMGKNLESPVLEAAGIIAQAIAQMLLGYATAAAQSAELGPFGWIGFTVAGLATVTSVIEQMKSIGQYAEGGIAYGPTLGLFGEYAGARTNPEVVAPLDRLRSLMSDGNSGPVDVRVRIKERDLVGFGRKSNRYRGRM